MKKSHVTTLLITYILRNELKLQVHFPGVGSSQPGLHERKRAGMFLVTHRLAYSSGPGKPPVNCKPTTLIAGERIAYMVALAGGRTVMSYEGGIGSLLANGLAPVQPNRMPLVSHSIPFVPC